MKLYNSRPATRIVNTVSIMPILILTFILCAIAGLPFNEMVIAACVAVFAWSLANVAQ